MPALCVSDGYRRWAPNYDGENAVSAIEDRLACALTPPLGGRSLLDAGCGTGRRLVGTAAAHAIGVDPCRAMLEAGIGLGRVGAAIETRLGNVRALPAANGMFDVLWCRLVLGHLPDPAPAYRELARVAKPCATLVVTDFHPAACAAGHRRTFRDREGVHEIEHFVHHQADHEKAGALAGWRLCGAREGCIDARALPYYAAAGRRALWADHAGLPVVLALSFRVG